MDKVQAELERLEAGYPGMVQQRDALNADILRVEGAILTLRGLVAPEETPAEEQPAPVVEKGAPAKE